MADTDQIKSMISGLEGKSLYGQLEPLMPEIDRKIREGVPRAQIHQLITDQGITITEGTLYNYLHRYRKRNSATPSAGKSANKPKPPAVQNGNSEVEPVAPVTESAQASSSDPSINDLLSNEQSREEFTNQYMTRPPIRRSKKT